MPDITVTTKDGGFFSAYLAGDSGPGIVVCQEIFGVNQVMRDIVDGFAAQGYMAICPDLFWRQEPGIQITDKTDEEWAKAFELFKGFDQNKGTEDLKATLAHLRSLDGCNGKAGSVGFCLGGKLAYLMACRSDADCNVGYYGVGIDGAVDEAKNITRPLMLHVATEDEFVPKDAQTKMHAALDNHPQVTIYDYEGNNHAFARVGGAHFDPAAADLANKRTAEFFKKHLG